MEGKAWGHLPSHIPAIPQRQPQGRAVKEDQCSTLVKYRMMGVKEMKIKLKKPNVETKCAASPKLALPRNILNITWNGKETLKPHCRRSGCIRKARSPHLYRELPGPVFILHIFLPAISSSP